MISTSSYKNWQSDKYTTYSISGDCGKDAGYKGKYFRELAPKLSFWKVWHKNIGILPEEENNRYYVEEYYKQVLSKLDPEKIYNKLDNSILLCYEENTEFCHRHIVAAWLELLLNINVLEKKAIDYNVEVVKKPDYIKEYLEDVMKKNLNMRGFNSLRALYLFEKGEELEKKAEKFKDVYDESTYYVDAYTGQKIGTYEGYMQGACYLRCDADEAEEQYNEQNLDKIKLTRNMKKF